MPARADELRQSALYGIRGGVFHLKHAADSARNGNINAVIEDIFVRQYNAHKTHECSIAAENGLSVYHGGKAAAFVHREGLNVHETAAGLAHEFIKRIYHCAAGGGYYASGKGYYPLGLHTGEYARSAYLDAALREQISICYDKVLCLANVIKPRPACYR